MRTFDKLIAHIRGRRGPACLRPRFGVNPSTSQQP